MITDLNWSDFKSIALLKERIRYIDKDTHYHITYQDSGGSFETSILKDSGTDHDEFENDYKSLSNKPVSTEVTTQQEKPDKNLVLASAEDAFSGTTCTLSIEIPGTLGDFTARLVAGGYAFTDVYGWNDRVTKVQVNDKNYVYAGLAYPETPFLAGIPNTTETDTWEDIMPDGVVMGSYCDDLLPESQRGWRFWCDDGNQGGLDIDPLGGFGKLPALTFLEIVIEKTATSLATKAAVNIWWGSKS